MGSVEHVRIDQDVVLADRSVISSDVTDPAHVGGKVINLIDAATGGEQAIVSFAQIQNFEFVGRAGFVFRMFYIHAAYPVPVGFQTTNQMMTDESSRSRDQQTLPRVHKP